MTSGDRPEKRERAGRDGDEDDQLENHTGPDTGGDRGTDGRERHRPEEEQARGQELADREKNGCDQPDDEARHVFNCDAAASGRREPERGGQCEEVGQLLVDLRVAVLAVEQESSHADRFRAFDVVFDRVADHHGGGGLDLEAS